MVTVVEISVNAGMRIYSSHAPADVARLIRTACKCVVPGYLTGLGYKTREGYIACEHIFNAPTGTTAPIVVELIVPSTWNISRADCEKLAMSIQLALFRWGIVLVEVIVTKQDSKHLVNITDLDAPCYRLPEALRRARGRIEFMLTP